MTPNFAIKLNSAGALILGVFSLLYLNNVLGGLLIIYSIINICTIQRRGDRQYKYNVIRINIVNNIALFILLSLLVLSNQYNNIIIIIPLLTLLIATNYIAVQNYKI